METIISIRDLVNQFGTNRVHDGLSMDVLATILRAAWNGRETTGKHE